MREHIICYDITCPRRLGRIHRALKKTALPIQYSVFLFKGTTQQLEHCIEKLEQLMDPNTDDIRIYPLPERGLRYSLGPGALPENVLWPGISLATPDQTSSGDSPVEAGASLYFL